MTKKIIFQDSFLVSGIMCFDGCGASIQRLLNAHLSKLIDTQGLPQDSTLVLDAEPQSLGIHRIYITVESEEVCEPLPLLSMQFKEKINDSGLEVIDCVKPPKNKNKLPNGINIAVNVVAIIIITVIWCIFPPSLPLTVVLTVFSFLVTAATARHHIITFFENVYNKVLLHMATPITLGWALSLAHTLYHAITMPLSSSISMMFMNYIMPIALITCINIMDELKAYIVKKSKKMHIKGMHTLFPQMADEYACFPLAVELEHAIAQQMEWLQDGKMPTDIQEWINLPITNEPVFIAKNALKKNTLIRVKQGQCFPVDGYIFRGHTSVDASILTGEPQQLKQPLDFVPAGAINLGEEVLVWATQTGYNSTVNKLLFVANRAEDARDKVEASKWFIYVYGALILLGMIAAITIPLALGLFTLPLLLQSLAGILFFICPCTIAIAHELPKLFSAYQRHNHGVIIRDDVLMEQKNEIHTIVFDKTGTLTTGQSEVESSEGISSEVWQRIYLLEKHFGAQHPVANAITQWYEKKEVNILFNSIDNVVRDSNGLSARVQNRQMHIGNADFFARNHISVPHMESIQLNTTKGYTPLYVAEDGVFQGVIFVKHAIRKDIAASLLRLKQEGKKIIMLTGDNREAALGFNAQNGFLFDEKDIHAEQKPLDKQHFLEQLMRSKDLDPKGVWFVGDGLNDAPCARIVTEKGGVSCAITAQDKAAFFTDISLNGSLDYLFEHNALNNFITKNIVQNQGIMIYSAIASLAFIITFSILGIGVPALIPTLLMVTTTLFAVFNAYRAKLNVEVALDKNPSLFKQALASDASIALLLTASTCLIAAILLATIATGGLALPVITFTSSIALAISSGFLITTIVAFTSFVVMGIGHLVAEWVAEPAVEEVAVEKQMFTCKDNEVSAFDYVPSSDGFAWGSQAVRDEMHDSVNMRVSI